MAVLEKRRALGFAACALASSLWGCGFFFGKIALAEMSFAHMVLYRFLFAMVALLPLLVTHRPGLNRREWGVLAAGCVSGRAGAVSAAVSRALDDDGEPCFADGGDDAGDSGGRRDGLCA